MKILKILILFCIPFLVLSCKKDLSDITGDVAFYLLESFEVSGYYQIDESSVVIASEPLIPYNEIESYDDEKHRFVITENMKEELMNRDSAIDFRAFAVVADDEIVYTGFFWPVYSSSICNWVVIDPVTIDMSNQLNVEIGYPGTPSDVEIPDKRNDQRIIDIFKRDRKLK